MILAVLRAVDRASELVHSTFDHVISTYLASTAASLSHLGDRVSTWWSDRIDTLFSSGSHTRLGADITRARSFRQRFVLPRRVEVPVVNELTGRASGSRWRRLDPGEKASGSRPYHECGECAMRASLD